VYFMKPRRTRSHTWIVIPAIMVLLWLGGMVYWIGSKLVQPQDELLELPPTMEALAEQASEHGEEVVEETPMRQIRGRDLRPVEELDEEKSEGSEDDLLELTFDMSDENTIRLRLLPELSPSSASFWREASSSACKGELYRNEDFLVQGRLGCHVSTTVVKGACPPGAKLDASRKCPSHDPQCGCHGPIMTHGMVGWAGGGTGPDFFIYTGEAPATHWQNDHTIIGEIADEASWDVLAAIHQMPSKPGGMTMLTTPVKLHVSLAS